MTIPECLDIITGQKELADQLHALRIENQRLRTALERLLMVGEYQTPEGKVESLFPLRFNQAKELLNQIY